MRELVVEASSTRISFILHIVKLESARLESWIASAAGRRVHLRGGKNASSVAKTIATP